MTEIPPPPRDGDPRHAADAAFLRSIEELGQRTAAERAAPPPRRRRRHIGRTVLVAILSLLVLGGGAVATKVFIAEDGSVPVESDPGKHIAQTPGDRRLGAARAKDPDNSMTWGIRVYYNNSGETCVLVGAVLDDRLGQINDGKFKALPEKAPGICHNMADHVLKTGRAFTDTPEPRTVLYGVVDRSILDLQLHTRDGRTHNIPIAPDGTYVLPLAKPRPEPLTNATLTTHSTTTNNTTPTTTPQPPLTGDPLLTVEETLHGRKHRDGIGSSVRASNLQEVPRVDGREPTAHPKRRASRGR